MRDNSHIAARCTCTSCVGINGIYSSMRNCNKGVLFGQGVAIILLLSLGEKESEALQSAVEKAKAISANIRIRDIEQSDEDLLNVSQEAEDVQAASIYGSLFAQILEGNTEHDIVQGKRALCARGTSWTRMT